MKSLIHIACIALACSLTGCKDSRKETVMSQQARQTSIEFKLPEIPAMYTTDEQRLQYVTQHYWDCLNLTDTTALRKGIDLEQIWANYLDLLHSAPAEQAQKAMKEFLLKKEMHPAVFRQLTGLAEKYLYDPNSPARNEELFIAALEAITTTTALNEAEKIRPARQLTLAKKNRVGTTALNFQFYTATGQSKTLHSLSAEWIILYFYEPDCHACAETTQALMASPAIHSLCNNHKGQLVAIYPDGKTEEWQKHARSLPSEWINGYDNMNIKTHDLYDLKATPTLYLLNRNKKVVLKDVNVKLLELYLQQNPQP